MNPASTPITPTPGGPHTRDPNVDPDDPHDATGIDAQRLVVWALMIVVVFVIVLAAIV